MHLSIGILSRSGAFYSTQRLFHEAAFRGLDVRLIHPDSVIRSEEIGRGERPSQTGVAPPYPHIVIPRVGSRTTTEDLAALNCVITGGSFSPVSAHAIELAQDKLGCSEVLRQAGLAQLPIHPVSQSADLERLFHLWSSEEIVLKPRRGTQGRGVKRFLREQLGSEELTLYLDAYPEAVAQPFVPLESPRDLRVLVLDGAVLAHCWRIAAPGEFRTNVHRGAYTKTGHVESKTLALAVEACAAIGLSFGGVDLLPTPSGLVVLEVNGSPGLEGIEKATERNLAADIVRWSCAQYRSWRSGEATSGPRSSLSS